MSPVTSTLPAGWSQIIDEAQMRLDHAIALADARIEQLPHLDADALERVRREEIAKWSERLQRLNAYLESAQQVVHSVDEILQREEQLLGQHLGTSETLRQRLAEGTGRAIG
jgi:predicted ATP-dependent protease